jgi:hypothetical protein
MDANFMWFSPRAAIINYCVLCELGSESLSIIKIPFLVKGLKRAYGAMFPLASDYSFSTHLLVQKADYIQDARYRGDLLLTKMWGAVRTAECELAHLWGHSYAGTCGAKWTVKPSTHVFWRKETIADTLTLFLKIKVSCPCVYTGTTWI